MVVKSGLNTRLRKPESVIETRQSDKRRSETQNVARIDLFKT